MKHEQFTAAGRGVISTLAALVLAAALPQLAFAAGIGTSAGVWKIDPRKSTYTNGAVTLRIERVAGTNPDAGKFVVVSNGSVYLVTGASAYDAKAFRYVDYERMMRDGSAVLIGTNARSLDICNFKCQSGLPDNRMTLTFRGISSSDKQIKDMIAYDAQAE